MNCEQALALVIAEQDGELQGEECAPLHSHLAACAECRTAADAFRLQDADLRRAFGPRRKAAAAVAERVIAQLPTAGKTARSRMPWLPMLVAAAAGFLLAAILFRPWLKSPEKTADDDTQSADQQKKETVLLAVASGVVEMLVPGSSDSWQALKTGGQIEVGSQVRTRPGVRCEFRTADGSEIRLNSGTQLVFVASRLLQLTQGQILASVAEASSPFQVEIPDATVTAVGTEFDLLCRPVESVLTVLQGSTRVEGNGSHGLVDKGQRAKIVKGKITEKDEVENLVQATRWVHEILILKGRDNKELAKRVDGLLAQLGQSKTEFLKDEEIRALGDHCVLPLTRFLQSDQFRSEEDRRRRAADILADLAQPWSIPDLINLLQDKDEWVRYHAARGLKRLTRDDLGMSPEGWSNQPLERRERVYKEWQKWWQDHKHLFPGADSQ
jgi:membrane protein implicated in regulation of membrane protease activity